jgi:hypothetical protein
MPEEARPRDYCLGVPGQFESRIYPALFLLAALFILLFPLWQLYRDEAVFWEILYALGPLAYFAYFFYRGVDRVRLYPDGKILFERVGSSRETSIEAIRRIRPWLWCSRWHFVVELDRGRELLMGSPITVAYLVRALREMRPEIHLVWIPKPPS